ncbi:hypothetical protein BDW71DRAFT_206070 [Aspergillus fruticulosus]
MAPPAQALPAPLPDHISHNYVIFISVAAVVTLLSAIIIVLRIIARVLTISAKWDDWACIVLANNVLYNNSVTFSKISVILLYRHIFTVSKPLRTATWIVGAAAQPWIPHTSIQNKAFWIAMGTANALLDLAILCMPQLIVWRLQQTRQRKVFVSLVCVGRILLLATNVMSSVCIASIVRLYYMATIDVNNVTCRMGIPGMWTMIEMDTIIICACLPIVPSMLKCYRQRRAKTNNGSNVNQGSASRAHLLSPGSSGVGAGGSLFRPTGLAKYPLFFVLFQAST